MKNFLIVLQLQTWCLSFTLCQKSSERLKLTGDFTKPNEFRPILTPTVPKVFHGPKFPKQNCTVLDEVLAADICTPSFETTCMIETLSTKKVIESSFCFTLNRTVCNIEEESIENEVCTYEYSRKEEAATAQTVAIEFDKKCRKQKVTVCDYAGYQQFDPYDPHGFNFQPVCKEVAQETCFNIPKVEAIDVPVTLAYPEPVRRCQSIPIILPKVRCHEEKEERCIKVPKIEEIPFTVEKCVPVIGVPKCQRVELVLPKQVCQDIIYGFTHRQVELTEK